MTRVWSLAGHDPMAAAGIQADLRVSLALGVHLRTLLVSFTAQNHESMSLCTAVPKNWINAQWAALRAAEQPQVIKLGLIADAASLASIAELLKELPEVPVIYDPVLASSSGFCIADATFLRVLTSELLPRTLLLTPNLPEAEQLLGYRVQEPHEIVQAARELRARGVRAVLIKGGHGNGTTVRDYYDDGERAFWLESDRKPGRYRGTGCSLASAIACELAKRPGALREAVVLGHAILQAALDDRDESEFRTLHFRAETPPLGRLSYTGDFPTERFPVCDREALAFYPIVPDLEWLKRLLPTGVRTIQLRLKNQSPAACARAIAEARVLCHEADVRLFVNDHWTLAMEEGAYGVHLGQEDLDRLSSADISTLRRSGLSLGISTHSIEEAARALSFRPSYIALGPIFPTTCKSMAFGPQGLKTLALWRRLCPDIPLVAIGGITLADAADIRHQGADGIAVISDLLKHPHPEQRTREWLTFLRRQMTAGTPGETVPPHVTSHQLSMPSHHFFRKEEHR